MNELLTYTEQLVFTLRKLYRQYGYSQFRMSKFESYDLYADKKDFLVSDGVITFTDTDGALLALKPDVTLSIIKNYRRDAGCLQKTYYDEHVYRTGNSGQGYREIMQTGLECIGPVDRAVISEVLLLAVKSLSTVSKDFVLDISHMGIPEQILAPLSLTAEQRTAIMRCLEEKNEDALLSLSLDIGDVAMQQLMALLHTYGPVEKVIATSSVLNGLPAFEELKELVKSFSILGITNRINLDFSIIGSRNYYNGIIFRGYVAGVPASVLSGGQYNKLMSKMGKPTGGIGFAVYLNELERLASHSEGYDCETVLLYNSADAEPAFIAAETMRADGSAVLMLPELPQGFTCRTLYRFRDGRLMKVDRSC